MEINKEMRRLKEDLFQKVEEEDKRWKVEEILEDQSKKSNIQIIVVPERGERKWRGRNYQRNIPISYEYRA